MDLKERAKKLTTDVPAVFLAMKRRDTPLSAKIFALLAVGYALSPIDLIPDFIPVLGYLDDVLILPLLVSLAVRRIPAEVFAECRAQAEDLWREGKPKRWYYALPIVGIWLAVAGLALAFIL